MAFPHRRAVIGAGLAVSALGLAACGRSEAPVDEQGRVRLRFATDWRAQAEHGGFYQALASGAPSATRFRGMKLLVPMPSSTAPDASSWGTFTPGPPWMIWTFRLRAA